MNKYVYSECPEDYWPEVKTIVAASYEDAVEKLINKYANEFDDDTIARGFDDFKYLREYLNDTYTFAISDLIDIESL